MDSYFFVAIIKLNLKIIDLFKIKNFFIITKRKEGILMLNQIVLVGRLVKKPELKESENGKKFSFITLAIPRSFKNINGEYDTDFIDCTLWDAVALSTVEYCGKGDIVGVRGRVQSRNEKLEIVVEKVTFLSQAKKTDDDEEII